MVVLEGCSFGVRHLRQKGYTMSINLDEAFVIAAVSLSPLAEVVIRDRDDDFKTDQEFAAFHPLLRAELWAFLDKVNTLIDEPLVSDVDIIGQARNLVNLIRVLAYKKALGTTTVLAQLAARRGPQVPTITPGNLTVTPQPPASAQLVPTPDPNGTNKCFNRNCGQSFTTFDEVMAHKVLVHGYSSGKYSQGWAKEIVAKVATTTVAAPFPATTVFPDPTLVTQTNLWTPRLNLDLRGLNLEIGEASRFAAGEQATARFYFIRLLKQGTKIKGKFVWTKFAHRYNWHLAEAGDFVVRKLAGDTKEWIGTQAPKGVHNPNYNWSTKATEPMRHFENVYVGEHEADIQEILKNPNEARRNYGRWRQECGYCGRNLTDAESRLRGIGPDCWEQKYIPSLYGNKP